MIPNWNSSLTCLMFAGIEQSIHQTKLLAGIELFVFFKLGTLNSRSLKPQNAVGRRQKSKV